MSIDKLIQDNNFHNTENMNLSGNRPITFLKFLLLSIVFIFSTGLLEAQTRTRVQLSNRVTSVQDVLKEIEYQTGYKVVNNGSLNTSKRVSVLRSEFTVNELMEELLSGTGQFYRISGSYIVIMDSNTPGGIPLGVQGIIPNPDVQGDNTRSTTAVDGVTDDSFTYPSRSRVPRMTKRYVESPFLYHTPPVFAVKTNLLYAATLTPNLAGEIGLGKKTTLELAGGINKWNQDGSYEDNKKFVHWLIKPEFRYWLCERFNGHFFGLHAFYAQYNIGEYDIPLLFEKEYRYEGDVYGGGISYGYHWMWSKRWGMEFNLGVGAAFLNYTRSACGKCSPPDGEFKKNYFGPTNAGIKLVYLIH